MQYGASLTTKDPDGFSVVHLAACQENPESVFVLTEMLNKTLLNVKDHLGRTPLIYACLMGFDKNVELLLSKKVKTGSIFVLLCSFNLKMHYSLPIYKYY